MAEQEAKRTRLRITECKSVYTGTNTRGDSYTIYEVKACDANGQPVGHKLTSFEELPLEVLDLNVTKYNSEQYGESFTLARANKPKTRDELKQLRQQVEALEVRVANLEMSGAQRAPPAKSATEQRRDEQYGAEAPY